MEDWFGTSDLLSAQIIMQVCTFALAHNMSKDGCYDQVMIKGS